MFVKNSQHYAPSVPEGKRLSCMHDHTPFERHCLAVTQRALPTFLATSTSGVSVSTKPTPRVFAQAKCRRHKTQELPAQGYLPIPRQNASSLLCSTAAWLTECVQTTVNWRNYSLTKILIHFLALTHSRLKDQHS